MCGWDNGSIGCLSLHFVSISERLVVLLLRSPWTIGDIPIGSLKKEKRNRINLNLVQNIFRIFN